MCKRCTNSAQYPCEWADRGIPVKGWVAEKGLKYQYVLKNGKTRDVYGYNVIECPNYIKEDGFSCYKDAAEHISKTLGYTLDYTIRTWYKCVKKYQELTGEKLPEWVINREVTKKSSSRRI